MADPDVALAATASAAGPATGDHRGFGSILYRPGSTPSEPSGVAEPACFRDLNLDQVVDSLTAGREQYDLKPYCYLPLHDVDAVAYRHEVFRDLERAQIRESVDRFARRMHRMRERLASAEKLRHPYQKQRWFLAAASEYAGGVVDLAAALEATSPASRGLDGLRQYLNAHLQSAGFTKLQADVGQLEAGLGQVRYRLHLKDTRVAVSAYRDEPDYSTEVLATFDKFKQGAPGDYAFDLPSHPYVNSVEEAILDRVALLYPELFADLTRFRDEHAGYLDEVVRRFDREVQLYLAVLEQRDRMADAGLASCYPEVSATSQAVMGHDVFDLALANRLVPEGDAVITNDFSLADPERIVVVTGPNQGGKTTFARAFGQLHYLAGLGFPVPARSARLFLCDRLFTHFDREEDLENQRGKLEDELIRIHAILEEATDHSVLVMNESLSSTTAQDALDLGRRILAQIIEQGLLCVFVTFLDELSALGPATVSMVSQIDPDDPARRTFRIERIAADGLAYAMAIARKHRLTYEGVRERVGP